VSRSSCDVAAPRLRHTVRVGELKMAWLRRWFAVMSLGGTLLAGLTSCVVSPVEPGYVASPPVMVIRPYRHYRPHRHYHYHPYRYYWPSRHYYSYPYGHGW
jgi:hypothetical protein